MKSILATLLLLTVTVANSATTVQVVWPFSPSSSQSVMARDLIESANKSQDKYQFVFINKPGAGGSIAANYTLNRPELTLMISSNSFYIRPLLYKDSHDVDQFKIIGMVCQAMPLGLFSRKYQDINQIGSNTVSVGLVPGSITALFARVLQRENPNFKIIEVPYKGTPEAAVDMMGGHLDTSVEFSGRNSTAKFDGDVKVYNLGITGTRNRDNFKTFKSVGIKGLDDVTVDFILFGSKNLDTKTLQEINTIFNNAITDKVDQKCSQDHGYTSKITLFQGAEIHENSKKIWAGYTKGLEKQ